MKLCGFASQFVVQIKFVGKDSFDIEPFGGIQNFQEIGTTATD